jgi:PAS domain-containing protein
MESVSFQSFGPSWTIGLLLGLLVLTILIAMRKIARLNKKVAAYDTSIQMAEKIGGVGSWLLDVKTQKLTWSSRVFAIHQRPEEMGVPGLDEAINYYHPEDRDRVQRVVTISMDTGQDYEFRARLITDLGTEKSVISQASCITDDRGQVTAVFGVFVETGQVVEIADDDGGNHVWRRMTS